MMQHLLCLSFRNTQMCYSKTLHHSFRHYQIPSVLHFLYLCKLFRFVWIVPCVFSISGDYPLRIRTWCSSSLCSLDWLCLWSLVPLRALLRTETVGAPTPRLTRDRVTCEVLVSHSLYFSWGFVLRRLPPSGQHLIFHAADCGWHD